MPKLMPAATRQPGTALAPIPGRLPSLHDDPHRIHQLLDQLGMPPGTAVRVTTVAASLIVR